MSCTPKVFMLLSCISFKRNRALLGASNQCAFVDASQLLTFLL
jgi:hypothetical protein